MARWADGSARAQIDRVPVLAIVGAREQDGDAVALRDADGQRVLALDAAVSQLAAMIGL